MHAHTIELPDALVDEVKLRAARTGRTFSSLVEEGLRLLLAQQRAEQSGAPEALPSYGEPGGRILVDLADRDAFWATLDADQQP